jgi:hypothetical protein
MSNVITTDLLLYFCVPKVVQYVLFADPILNYKFILTIFIFVLSIKHISLLKVSLTEYDKFHILDG